jgi:hypothetical protein
MDLTNNNYFSPEAASKFWSVSQFKAFNRCEAAGLAEVQGEYVREPSEALLIGSYVVAYFSGELEKFREKNADKMFTKKGDLYSKFYQANAMIDAIENQPLMVEMLEGEKQVVMTADLFGLPWKIKMDVYNERRIVDLKTVRDFEDIWDPAYGARRSWIEYWGYDIQGAVYQKVVEMVTGEKLPFYLVAVTKERIPDVDIIEIPQHVLDAALGLVEAKIERFDLIKSGQVEPIRCERCDYCKSTKKLTEVRQYKLAEE